MDVLNLVVFSFIVNAPVGYVAYKKNTLTMPDGFLAAAGIGMLIFVASPLLWLLLMTFFVSANILTKYKETSTTKEEAMAYAEKGGRRDMWQVFANGGSAAILAILVLYVVYVQNGDNVLSLALGVAVAIAASNADTWSTEIGTTSKYNPVWIFNPKKRVPRGTSGGISLKGLGGGILGSLLIALLFCIYPLMMHESLSTTIAAVVIVTVGGTLGTIIDTILGASVQVVYFCEVCQKETEKKLHTKCGGTKTVYSKGIKWLTNDTVNFFSPLLATLLSLILWVVIIQ